MDLCGVKVHHRCFGHGEIAAQEEGHVRVLFAPPHGEKLFVYPDVFQGFLTAMDEGANAQILRDITARKEAEKQSAIQQTERIQAFCAQVAAEKAGSRSVHTKTTAAKGTKAK